MKFKQLSLALLTSGLVLPSQGAASLEFLASEFDFPTHFYQVNPNTGQAMQIGSTTFLPGLDFRRNEVLYGASDSLYTVSKVDGSAAKIGELPELVSSIAFSWRDRLYALSNSGETLYEIDPNTGTSLGSVLLTGTIHGNGTPFPGEINGIDFLPNSDGLFGIGFGLYHINPLTGVCTRITPLGRDVSGDLFTDLDFATDGELRSASFGSAAEGFSNLYRIDLATGLGVLIGPMGADIAGLASIPEPSMCTLLIAGSGLLFLGRKWRPTHRAAQLEILEKQ